MNTNFKVNEIFASIQGEGRYQGFPVIFVRLAGCTRQCSFCDTKYHNKYRKYTIPQLIKRIKEYPHYSNINTIVFTGGEPLLQLQQIKQLKKQLPKYYFHLETNGDLITTKEDVYDLEKYFTYVCISPKILPVAKRIYRFLFTPWYDYLKCDFDIKIVTDLRNVGTRMIPYATMLMPLTTYNKKRDEKIRKRVWEFCILRNLYYSARLHVEVWKKKRRV